MDKSIIIAVLFVVISCFCSSCIASLFVLVKTSSSPSPGPSPNKKTTTSPSPTTSPGVSPSTTESPSTTPSGLTPGSSPGNQTPTNNNNTPNNNNNDATVANIIPVGERAISQISRNAYAKYYNVLSGITSIYTLSGPVKAIKSTGTVAVPNDAPADIKRVLDKCKGMYVIDMSRKNMECTQKCGTGSILVNLKLKTQESFATGNGPATKPKPSTGNQPATKPNKAPTNPKTPIVTCPKKIEDVAIPCNNVKCLVTKWVSNCKARGTYDNYAYTVNYMPELGSPEKRINTLPKLTPSGSPVPPFDSTGKTIVDSSGGKCRLATTFDEDGILPCNNARPNGYYKVDTTECQDTGTAGKQWYVYDLANRGVLLENGQKVIPSYCMAKIEGPPCDATLRIPCEYATLKEDNCRIRGTKTFSYSGKMTTSGVIPSYCNATNEVNCAASEIPECTYATSWDISGCCATGKKVKTVTDRSRSMCADETRVLEKVADCDATDTRNCCIPGEWDLSKCLDPDNSQKTRYPSNQGTPGCKNPPQETAGCTQQETTDLWNRMEPQVGRIHENKCPKGYNPVTIGWCISGSSYTESPVGKTEEECGGDYGLYEGDKGEGARAESYQQNVCRKKASAP